MARVREKYGSGVVGLPLPLRVVITATVTAPSAFWLLVSLALGSERSPWTALTLAIAVLFATPAYLLLPSVWERTNESVMSEWRAHDLQRRLTRQLDCVGPDLGSLHERERPPSRW